MALNYPRLGNASGIWTMKEVTDAVKGGYWPKGGARGVVGGECAITNEIEYITITTTGDATDFGNLTVARQLAGAAASHTRGLFACGNTPSYSDVIDYITIASTGNAADFGDATFAFDSVHAGASNSVRAVFAGGYKSPNVQNIMDYVQISSLGDATDYGDLTVARQNLIATASPTRGLWFGGGDPSAPVVTIDYATLASTGNNADFGDMTSARRNAHAGSTGVIGAQGGGRIAAAQDTIDFVTIASTGNGIDFGDLSQARSKGGSNDNSTRLVVVGGQTADPSPSAHVNTIDYININIGGTAVDFGDTTAAKSCLAGLSNAHGGLNDGNQGVVDTT
jgi:hypothetical protein